jgi:pyocin large subunit-like protein
VSWQATAWAARQRTGSPAAKLTLLALANYADADGMCWPTQETLAADTEQSVDTVQRRLKQLATQGLIRIEKRKGLRGQWTRRIYFLNTSVAEMTEPQIAARSDDCRAAVDKSRLHAATGPSTMPQRARPPCRIAVRHKQTIEHPIEPSAQTARASREERLRAFQENREGDEVVQNRIAQRLGHEGWLIIGAMPSSQSLRRWSVSIPSTMQNSSLLH